MMFLVENTMKLQSILKFSVWFECETVYLFHVCACYWIQYDFFFSFSLYFFLCDQMLHVVVFFTKCKHSQLNIYDWNFAIYRPKTFSTPFFDEAFRKKWYYDCCFCSFLSFCLKFVSISVHMLQCNFVVSHKYFGRKKMLYHFLF